MITADVFSGRPNPSWIVTDEQEARAALRELAQNQTLTMEAAPADAGLGLRGFLIEPLSDELTQDFALPASLYLPAEPTAANAQRLAIADRLIALIDQAEPAELTADAVPLEAPLQQFLREQLQPTGRIVMPDTPETPAAEAEVEAEAAAAICYYDLSPYNPGFWNNNTTILRNNNCYNYASNRRTDTFAQPGRGCGNMYRAINCTEMTRASLCDGLHRRYNCFPSSEAPRYLVALVVAPGPGFIDFHWYRKMREGYWAHKPGGTPVRNVDNSNRVIYDPATCNRGLYTHFCGYFYTCRSQRIR